MAKLAIGADEKKKLYVLGGLLAAIGVVGVVLYMPRGTSSDDADATPTPAPKATTVPQSAGGSGTTPPAGGTSTTASAAGGAPGSVSAASLISVQSFRDDPFAPFARPVLPVLPSSGQSGSGSGGQSFGPGPVEIPSPEQSGIIPGNDTGLGGGLPTTGVLPPMGVDSSAATARPLADMPPISLPTRGNIPSTPGPPGGGNQASGGITESPNKRVSGVVIGDSVRASIEITDGDTKTTRVVQPGDEIDGIRILRIERATVGGRAVTRVIVRENGEERAIILKPAPRETAAAGTGRTTRP